MARDHVQVHPITDSDVPEVARFLHAHMNRRVPVAAWAAAMRSPWLRDAPNHGYLLRSADGLAGAYVAIYSERLIDGQVERFCNLAAWCVLDEYRFASVRLLRALLKQDGYQFTDFSPSGNVIALNERLGFRRLDTSTALVLNLPWPTLPGRSTVTGDPLTIERALEDPELKIYKDHSASAGARHVLLQRNDEQCHVIFRRDRRKGIPLFATILYASNPALFRAMSRQLGRHLLLRHGLPAMLVERRVGRCRPSPSLMVRTPRPKMFWSTTVTGEQIDYLYSELVVLNW
jgi:hypothetical protein